MRFKDLTGQRFGKLTVVEIAEHIKGKHIKWRCVCDCGKALEVLGCNLTTGHTKSCDCYKRQRTSETKITHGMSNSRLNHIWKTIHSRCELNSNKSYKDYGGRGITVCSEWKYFESFMEWAMENGYQEHLTIERINVNGNYEPSNCKWVTIKEQANNKTNNVFITYKGETKTLAQWAEYLDLPYKTLYNRLKFLKWSIEETFEKPVYEILKGKKTLSLL